MRAEREKFLADEAKFTTPKWPSAPYNGEHSVEVSSCVWLWLCVRLTDCGRRCEQTIPIHLRSTWDMCNDIVWDVAEAFLDSRKGVQEVVKETAAQRLQWQTRRDRIYRRVGETEVLTSISGVVSAMVDEVIKDAAEEILGDLDYFKRLVFHSTTDMLIKASVTPLHKHGYDTVRYPPGRHCFPSHASPCFWLAVLGCAGPWCGGYRCFVQPSPMLSTSV